MKIEQRVWTEEKGWNSPSSSLFTEKSQLVILFCGSNIVKNDKVLNEVKESYPNSTIVGCTSAGEILETQVYDDSLVVTAVVFENTPISSHLEKIESPENSYQTGKDLIQKIPSENLKHVIIFSEGIHLNGSELVRGIRENIPANVGLSGGLAGDGISFKETFVFYNGEPIKNGVVAVAFYGDRIQIGHGSMGGFSPFGPERLVTKSKGNILYELDDQPAVELYKKYLGEEKSKDLATNQFFFPLSYRNKDMEESVVRTILTIDEENNCMVFAGDLKEGGYARLMKTNPFKLVEGSDKAAQFCVDSLDSDTPDLAILISCVGRKIILKQRVEEEVEAVRFHFKNGISMTGFYSYGEIAQFNFIKSCQLHNQTMTITVFKEN